MTCVCLITMYGLQAQAVDTTAWFDFWVGDWEVSWDEGDGKKGGGTNRIERILNGSVIQENFETTSGQNKGFLGTSITVYNPRAKQWKQAWADSQGGYFDLTGRLDGDKRIFQTAVRKAGDQAIVQRMVFYDIKKDSFTWDWEGSRDGGENWSLLWRINYKRAE